MLKKRTYRVKAGFGKHNILVINEKGRNTRVKILPGQTFTDYPDSRNVKGFEYKLEAIERGAVVPDEVLKEEIEKEEVADSKNLKRIPRGNGRYDVINVETGEKINDKLLTKREADALLSLDDGDVEEEEEEKAEAEESTTEKKKRIKIEA